MTGKYQIVLYNNKIQYRLSVERNLTLLRGDSATGKSELIRLLTQYNGNPHSSGITLICDKECIVLNEGNWRLFLQTYHGRIFFIDEGNTFLRTQEFTDEVKCSDNYFVTLVLVVEACRRPPNIYCDNEMVSEIGQSSSSQSSVHLPSFQITVRIRIGQI